MTLCLALYVIILCSIIIALLIAMLFICDQKFEMYLDGMTCMGILVQIYLKHKTHSISIIMYKYSGLVIVRTTVHEYMYNSN